MDLLERRIWEREFLRKFHEKENKKLIKLFLNIKKMYRIATFLSWMFNLWEMKAYLYRNNMATGICSLLLNQCDSSEGAIRVNNGILTKALSIVEDRAPLHGYWTNTPQELFDRKEIRETLRFRHKELKNIIKELKTNKL